jgi:hydroxyquinol 1,2-dioxygenase
VTTPLFDDADPYLDSDAVFAVKDSLICHFVRHDESDEASRQFALDPPFYTVEFDFVLKKVGLT